MIGRCFVVVSAVVLMAGMLCADESPDLSPQPNSPPVTCDIVYFHRNGPIFIRVRIEVDGASFEEPWIAYVQSLFTELDSDNDSRWTAEEVAGTLNATGGGHSRDVLRLARDPDLWSADRSPFDGAITMEELTAFLTGRQRGPFQAPDTASATVTRNAVGSTLFQLLDLDREGSLSAEELAAAMKTLHRRDLDDDETFGALELRASSSPYMVRPVPRPTEETRPFVTLVSGFAPISVLKEIERRYSVPRLANSGTGRRTLSRDLDRLSLGLELDVFNRYDFDGDQKLDRDELRELLRRPPTTLELIVRLGNRGDNEFVVEQVGSAKRQNIAVRRSTDGLACIVIDDVQIEVAAAATAPDVAKQYLLRQFAAADRDQNNYLDEKEAGLNDALRGAFDQFDEDGDGKLFEMELTSVIDGRTRAAQSRTRMDVQNCGRDLFGILDGDRNGRLGRRELTQAVQRIELWDSDGDGAVAQAEIPQLFQITFGPGQPQFRGVRTPGQAAGPAIEGGATTSAAPTWFRKLDRNNDGELTRREFPGTLGEFQKSDRNSDGVVDAAEAEFVK